MSEPLGDPDGEPDFAEEHQRTTFVDDTSGGPEQVEEEESPDSLGGMDS